MKQVKINIYDFKELDKKIQETLIDILEENKYLKNGTVYSEEMF